MTRIGLKAITKTQDDFYVEPVFLDYLENTYGKVDPDATLALPRANGSLEVCLLVGGAQAYLIYSNGDGHPAGPNHALEIYDPEGHLLYHRRRGQDPKCECDINILADRIAAEGKSFMTDGSVS